MKRVIVAVVTMVIAILLLSVLLYAGDEKSVKKETPKNPQVQTQKSCQDKHAQGVCTGHDSTKCTNEKGSATCLEKHAKNDCKGHDAGKCQHDKCSVECKEKCVGHDKPPK